MSEFLSGDLVLIKRRALSMEIGNPVIEAYNQVELIARGEAGQEFTIYGMTYRMKAPMWLVSRGEKMAIVAERHLLSLRGDFGAEGTRPDS